MSFLSSMQSKSTSRCQLRSASTRSAAPVALRTHIQHRHSAAMASSKLASSTSEVCVKTVSVSVAAPRQQPQQQQGTQQTHRDLLPNLLSLSATATLCLLFAASPDSAHAATAAAASLSASADALLTSAPAVLSATTSVPNTLMQLADTTTTTATGIQISTLDSRTMAKLAAEILRPALSIGEVLYIVRVPMTWYPEIDGKKLPWVLAYAPTEPILSATRKVVPLVGGVDVTPILWVGLLSFFNEILIGPQGILNLIQRQTGSGL